jgi:hypothetical protein
MVKILVKHRKKHKPGLVLDLDFQREDLSQISERLNTLNYHKLMLGVPHFIGIY